MSLTEKIETTVKGYIEAVSAGDVPAIMALYTQNCTVEDPVGSPPKEGSATVAEFYTNSVQTGVKLNLDGEIRIAGNEAAFPFVAKLDLGGTKMEIHVIDVMSFDDDGKIKTMRAFFGEQNMKQV